MSDETTTFTPPVAAIPSRAAQPAPMSNEPIAPPVRRRRTPRKKTARLPAREIKRIKKARAKNIAKRRAAPKPAKNPNRPLELKNQMHTVLALAGTLQKAELQFFTQAASAMQGLSRSGRKRVIQALQQVYGWHHETP